MLEAQPNPAYSCHNYLTEAPDQLSILPKCPHGTMNLVLFEDSRVFVQVINPSFYHTDIVLRFCDLTLVSMGPQLASSHPNMSTV